MKQKYAVLVFWVLIAASATTSFSSYRATERLVQKDMSPALALCTLAMLCVVKLTPMQQQLMEMF